MENGVLDKVADATTLAGVGVATIFGFSVAEMNEYVQLGLGCSTAFALTGAGWYHWSRARIINSKHRNHEDTDFLPPEDDDA